MREAGPELWSWLKDGAHFYVCGDAKRMAKDVENALVEISAEGRPDERGRRPRLHRRAEGHGPLPGGCVLMAQDLPTLHALSPSPCLRGEGRGEGRPGTNLRAAVGNVCAAPHPNPLPTEEWGEGTMSVRTTCPYCGVGCGVIATPDGTGGAAVRGDPQHPANCGRLCSKGSALGETLGLETRLLHPIVDGERASWDDALDHVAARLAAIRAAHGPEAIAFYLSGQLLTEDYYVANKLAKGFIGTPHVDTNSRLCMASSVAGHRRAFGADVVPQCYEDLELADLVVLAGSNAAWCHPVLYQRIQSARAERGVRVVNIDPRRTATSEGADLQLSIKPRHRRGAVVGPAGVAGGASRCSTTRFIAQHTQASRRRSSRACEIAPTLAADRPRDRSRPVQDIALFYEWFAGTPRVRLLLQPGREPVGAGHRQGQRHHQLPPGHRSHRQAGLRTALPHRPAQRHGRARGRRPRQHAGRAHGLLGRAERDRVRRFWKAPNVVAGEGLKAVDMFDAIADGRIKALWVMGTNPAVSLPRADAVREALAKLELLVVSENVASNDTLRSAHVRLPAAAWGEKDGTVTNSERRISRQRAFLPLAGEARPDWWILSEVARRLGYGEAFAYALAWPRYSTSTRACPASRTTASAPSTSPAPQASAEQAYDALEPFQWPLRDGQRRAERLFAEGGFFTPDRKARFVAIAPPRRRRAGLGRLAVRAQHRPRARPVAHHDAHGAVAAPLRATSPSRSWRSIPTMPPAWAWSRERWRSVCTVHGAAIAARARQRAASSRARCSCRSTGRPRTASSGPHRRARAAGDRSRSPASPSPRRRRRASPRWPVAHYGFALSRQPLQASPASPIGPRHGTRSGTCSTSRCDAPRQSRLAARGSTAALPEGERVTFAGRGAPASIAWRVHAERPPGGAAVCRPEPEAAVAGVAEVAVRAHQTFPARRAARAAGRHPARRGRSTRARSCACASRWAPRRIEAAAAAGDRSVEGSAARLGAGTNCGSLHSRDPPPDWHNGRPPVSPR